MDERSLPLEILDDTKREITTVDLIIATSLSLGVGIGGALVTFALYVKHCQEYKGVIIKEGK